VRRWYPGVEHSRPASVGQTHRALDDIRDSVAEMAYYRDRVFRSPDELKKPAT
jgi:oligoribonuclease